jgi:hypothetical protein
MRHSDGTKSMLFFPFAIMQPHNERKDLQHSLQIGGGRGTIGAETNTDTQVLRVERTQEDQVMKEAKTHSYVKTKFQRI